MSGKPGCKICRNDATVELKLTCPLKHVSSMLVCDVHYLDVRKDLQRKLMLCNSCKPDPLTQRLPPLRLKSERGLRDD